jgi:hypothetical protein
MEIRDLNSGRNLISVFFKSPTQALEHTHPPIQGVPGFCPEGKEAGA